MANPWDKYKQPAAAPWAKYAPQDPRTISPEQRAANVAANAGNQAEIDAMAQPEMGAAPAPPGMAATALLGATQGATFGFGDEIVARIMSADPNITYDQALQMARDTTAAGKNANPVTGVASEIAGAVLGGMGAAKAGAGALGAVAPGLMGGGLAGASARGLVGGALQGGAYGFGAGEGDGRMESAGMGALIGGAAGGAIPGLVAGASKGINAAWDAIGGAVGGSLGAGGRSSRALQTALSRSGMTVDQVDDAVRSAAGEGQPVFTVADALGSPGQRMLSGVARQPGDARNQIVDMLTKRQDGQGRRLGSFVADALDAPDTAAQRTAGLTAARGQAADAAYDAARGGAGPVDIRSALSAIDDRIGGMQGSGVVGDGIDAKLSGYRSRLAAQPGPDGVSRELSDFDRVLGVKQAIQDDIGAAVRSGRNNEARELGKLQSALDAALEESSGGYRAANDGFRTASRVIDQVDAGKAATSGRVRSADTLQTYGRLTADEQAAFKSGYADPLLAKIEGSAPGVNKVRPLMDEASAAELGAMAKDPALLQRQLGREGTMFETNALALGGSRTADNLQDIADVGKFDTGMIANLLSGRIGAAAGQLLPKLAGKNEATRALIARALLSGDAKAALAPIAQDAAKSASNRKLMELLLNSTQRAITN